MMLSDGLAAPQEGSSGAAEVRTPKMTPHDRRDKGQNRSVEAIGWDTRYGQDFYLTATFND